MIEKLTKIIKKDEKDNVKLEDVLAMKKNQTLEEGLEMAADFERNKRA